MRGRPHAIACKGGRAGRAWGEEEAERNKSPEFTGPHAHAASIGCAPWLVGYQSNLPSSKYCKVALGWGSYIVERCAESARGFGLSDRFRATEGLALQAGLQMVGVRRV